MRRRAVLLSLLPALACAPAPRPVPDASAPVLDCGPAVVTAGDSIACMLRLGAAAGSRLTTPGPPPALPTCHWHLPARIPGFRVGEGSVHGGRMSPRGDRLLLPVLERGDAAGLHVVELPTGDWRGRIPGPWPVHLAEAVAVSPDGRLVAVGTGRGTVELHDLETGVWLGRLTHSLEMRGEAPADAPDIRRNVSSVRFSPDGRLLASAGLDGRVVLWDVRSRRSRRAAAAGPPGSAFSLLSVAFVAGGDLLLVAGELGVRALDVRTGRWQGSLRAPVGLVPTRRDTAIAMVWSAALFVHAADAGRLAAVHGRTVERVPGARPEDEVVTDWISLHPLPPETAGPLITVSASLSMAVPSPDGRWVAGIGPAGIHVWEAATGREAFRIPATLLRAEDRPWNDGVEFSPDGRLLYTIHNHARPVIAWDLAGGGAAPPEGCHSPGEPDPP